jgi:hypothetical protein
MRAEGSEVRRQFSRSFAAAIDPTEPTMAFVKLIPQSQLPQNNEAQNFPCDGKMICIANV